jgi:hypothetical protein
MLVWYQKARDRMIRSGGRLEFLAVVLAMFSGALRAQASDPSSAAARTGSDAKVASAAAAACSGMSLGNGAGLNGFVPFPSTNAWNTNVASLTPDKNSAAIVAASGFEGVDSTITPSVPINVIDYASESDVVVAPYPATAPIEGAPADCSGWPDTYVGDSHVLVLDRAKCFLYETYNTHRCNGLYNASSETIWDMTTMRRAPGAGLRPMPPDCPSSPAWCATTKLPPERSITPSALPWRKQRTMPITGISSIRLSRRGQYLGRLQRDGDAHPVEGQL